MSNSIRCEASLGWDDELQQWFIDGVNLPSDVKPSDLGGLSNRVFIYKDGRLVGSITTATETANITEQRHE